MGRRKGKGETTSLSFPPSHHPSRFSPFSRETTGDESAFTALFTNMRILKFKSQLTIAFFAAVNHLNGPLRKKNFILTGSKGHGL